jgi:hypothetical protein
MWSEIEFPDQIGSLNFDDKMVYGGATHGVTARYLGDQRVATISIYDRGLTDVPNDIGAGVVRDAFAKACRDLESGVAQGAYRKVAFRDSSETVVRLPWREMRFLRATFDVELADSDPKLVTEMTTHIFLTVVDGVFHRERYSHPADITGDAEANRALEDFAGSIALRYLDRDWSSEDDFRRAQPEIRRVAQWLARRSPLPAGLAEGHCGGARSGVDHAHSVPRDPRGYWSSGACAQGRGLRMRRLRDGDVQDRLRPAHDGLANLDPSVGAAGRDGVRAGRPSEAGGRGRQVHDVRRALSLGARA